MKSFPAHLKEFQVVYDEKASRKLGRPKAKWVKVVFQVPSRNHRTVMSIASRLSRHFRETWANRYLTVIHPFGPEMSAIRAARELARIHDEWKLRPSTENYAAYLQAQTSMLTAARELPGKELGLV